MSYAQDRAEAYKDLKEDGKAVVLRSPASGGTFNPVTGETTDAKAAVDYSTYAVESSYDATVIDGTRVKADDRRFYVAAVNTAGAAIPMPGPDWLLYIGTTSGTKLQIAHVKPVIPGDTAVLYEVQARG